MAFKIKADLTAKEVEEAIIEYVEKRTGMVVTKVTLPEYYDASGYAKVELQKERDDDMSYRW